MPTNVSMRTEIGSIVLATTSVQLANGFFGTFISLRVATEDFAAPGMVLSSYFFGFTLGALRCARMIERIGHIRAYAAFAGMVIAATAVMPLAVGSLPWIVLRLIVGFGCAGIFVTTESWLSAKAPPSERGLIFSIYMVGTFLALGLGQLLIARTDIKANGAFDAIIALFAIALVIVTVARAGAPRIIAGVALRYGVLARAAPIAVGGCALSGLVGGCFYALVPAWMQSQGTRKETIALFMLVAVLGGFAYQVPVGRLSDRFDRRVVIAGLSICFAATAFVLVLLPRSPPAILPAAFLLGGFMSSLYPVCVAHAHDRMPADRVVAVSSRLILVSGIGSVLGPLIGAPLMAHTGIDGVFYLMAVAVLPLALGAAIGGVMAPPARRLQAPFEILMPQAGPLAHDPLDSTELAIGPAQRSTDSATAN